ncbi:MAG: hypothetical protein QF718_09325 [Phycisphaerales bacterium]|jgi:hypothetical protein|nr:hypothetical protein [Phycisphaerales bacterium]
MRHLITTFTLLVIGTAVQIGNAYPKATDRADRWQLRLETGDLRFYRDTDSGEGYWLLMYEVTNETNEDHRWVPNFELVTDKGDIIVDGENVPRRVQLDVLEIFGDPLLIPQSDSSGPLLQGEENAIRSFVIWKAENEDVREIQVFAGGVSGDTAKVIHPITGEERKLRRVLQLSWFVDGGVNQITLKPLPKRPVGGGTSIRRLNTEERDNTGIDAVPRKWIFR